MNTDTINLVVRRWKIEAEHDGEKYHLYIESPCGEYYSSLPLVEDTGCVEDSYMKTRQVPKAVLNAAIDLDDKLYEDEQLRLKEARMKGMHQA